MGDLYVSFRDLDGSIIRGFVYVHVNNIKEDLYVTYMDLHESIIRGFMYVHVNNIKEGSLCIIHGSK